MYTHTLVSALILLLLIPAHLTAQSLTIYSGRSKALVEPLIEKFEEESGIRANVRYGSSTQLAVAMLEEGRRTPADVFWAQDAGALGAVHRGDMLEQLPSSLLEMVPGQFHNTDGTWIATSGRARVMAFSKTRVDSSDLPESVFGLTDGKWKGRVGWAPSNGSFQSFLTSMRILEGDDATLEWLRAMKDNDAESYINNSALLQAVSAGEIDVALTNHYYLYRFRENNPDFPVDQTFFEAGDPGNLVNVAGIGMLKNARNEESARAFIQFLLEKENQQWVTDEVFEYPVHDEVTVAAGRMPLSDIRELSPTLDLDKLSELDQTLNLLRRAGLL
ncbi:iron ABC transporter substrate-binding protein [Natronogracilivirga saccharolytica]|uniref:Iron ABC transporter substrate-binding protein n=1 Tax=Natronogracilivirga saccharolytica TaxID=2812953 RepID=A0A8J7UU86_9BACT|nr:iron ABC transporter substrate-binding protein [Natronogracilivirga saccharolytica]MBP3191237.1 iron ABC transporter substrate-binding protein [Natronogracilivirga saccharolytica]